MGYRLLIFAVMYDEINKNENILLKYLEQADYYKKIKDYQSAIDCYEKFLQIDNSKASVCTITADLYSKLNGSESINRQIELYEQAYKLNPESRLALHGLAFGYEKSGLNDKAKIFYEKLLENNPTENDFYNYGGFLIRCGDFKNGHKFFAHRFNIDDINLKYPSNINKKWDFISDISDKVLLVHYEQGFGDSIMYCRFVPFLKNLAKKIIFVVQEELFDLISKSEIFKGVEIITNETNIDYDFNIALLDVPNVLNIDSNNLPFTSKYIDVNEDSVKNYKNKFLGNDNIFRIGISCKGENSANYSERDIVISEIFNLFKDISGIKLYNLQKDADKFDNITQLGKTFENFTDSACAVENMDLIISTDNVILNLAGALGIKTIGLFNKETNYRWFKTSGDNIGWYESVYPLQNKKQNDWNDVLSKLSETVLKYYKYSDIIK